MYSSYSDSNPGDEGKPFLVLAKLVPGAGSGDGYGGDTRLLSRGRGLGGSGGGLGSRWCGRRVGESGVGDRVDRSKMSIFGFIGKRPTGKLSGSGGGWPTLAGGRLAASVVVGREY
nr:hypothetical protein [Tanacetum cinerariifolium]